MDSGSIFQIVIQGGAFALVAFLFVQLVKTTLPAMVKDFREEGKANRDAFIAEVGTQRKAFSDELVAIREAFGNDFQKIFLEELNRQRGELNQQRVDFRDELSKQRHGFLNIINSLQLANHLMMTKLKANGASAEDICDMCPIRASGEECKACPNGPHRHDTGRKPDQSHV